jgi:hypothetical protein
MNDGKNWSAYHVFMQTKDGRVIDRVPHDYQNIEPMFRGNGVAFPSDQVREKRKETVVGDRTEINVCIEKLPPYDSTLYVSLSL